MYGSDRCTYLKYKAGNSISFGSKRSLTDCNSFSSLYF